MAAGCSRSTSYEVLNDDKRLILRRYYDKGMTSTGKIMEDVIAKAASEINTSTDRVKKWIGNEKRKRKASSADLSDINVPVKSCPAKRGTTAYNLFCSTMLNSDECKHLGTNSEKLKLAIDRWNALPAEEHRTWIEKAKELQKFDPSQLTEKQQKQQITKAKKQLVSQLAYLECLGCEASALLLEPVSGITQYGTERGLQFLHEHEKIYLNFREFFDSPKRDINYRVCDVVKLFNQKYSEAFGKVCKVPYLRGGFEATGLPEGIEFKKPGKYGLRQVHQIMENAANIRFVIKDVEEAADGQDLGKLTDIQKQMYSQLLTKVADDATVTSCLLMDEVIGEKDLEVTNLDLLKSEFDLLTTQLSTFFDTDAMTALAANYESGKAHQGYVLPAYTDTEEPYWLFYYPGYAANIETLHPEHKISGHWLDKTSQKLNYKLVVQNEETSIVGLNLICHQDKELGSLRLKQSISVQNGTQISVPRDFAKSILECLAQQGFL